MKPVVHDPNNYKPQKGLITRYAKKIVDKKYYGSISAHENIGKTGDSFYKKPVTIAEKIKRMELLAKDVRFFSTKGCVNVYQKLIYLIQEKIMKDHC